MSGKIPTYTPGSVNLLEEARKKHGFKFITKEHSAGYLELTSGEKCFYQYIPAPGLNPKPITMVSCHGGGSDCYCDPDGEKWAAKNGLGFFACDLMTYGKSDGYDPTEENYKISDHANQIIEVVTYASDNFFPGHKILLAGYSFGGQMCFLSIRDSEFRKKIHGVLTCAASVIEQSYTADMYRNGELSAKQCETLHLTGTLRKRKDGEVYRFNRDYVRDNIENCSFLADSQDVLGVDFPVTILHGTADDVIGVEAAHGIEKKIKSPKWKKIIIEGADHYFEEKSVWKICLQEFDEILKFIECGSLLGRI